MKTILLLAALAIAGCASFPPPQQNVTTNQTEEPISVGVKRLPNGCEIFRVEDKGVHYFAMCPQIPTI